MFCCTSLPLGQTVWKFTLAEQTRLQSSLQRALTDDGVRTSTRHNKSWEHSTADLFPTQAHLRQLSGGSFSFSMCQREASGSETQLIRHCCVRGLVLLAQPSLLRLLSLSNAQCALWLCAFLSCVGNTFSLCSSRTWSLSEPFPLWASLCVGRRVCERLVGGRRPAANSTYCCIAGARLSGSLPAV